MALNLESPHDPAIPLLGLYTQKSLEEIIYTPMFIAALLTTARRWKQPKCPPTGEWINKTYIHTHVKKGNSDTSYNMDEPDTKGQMLYNSTRRYLE